MNDQAKRALEQALESLNKWNNSFGAWNQHAALSVPQEKVDSVFEELAHRLTGNYPFHHPAYAGQMLKPPHDLAWAAYALAMSINPNNHALDGGPPSSQMEKEVIAEFARFFGYGDTYLGHLSASGTIANLEALWVARQSHPGKKIAFSENSHYTHERMCGVLGVEGVRISINDEGYFDLEEWSPEEIGTVVVTMGTTGLGDVERLDQILPWAKANKIRVHIDAAYGGFYRVLKDSGLINGTQWNLMQEADSIVVDPHKHGMQPFGCGCVLFKDPSVGRLYKHDSPYTYFTSEELHLGEISLECSRAGASAVALWAILKLFPLKEKEGFGTVLSECRKAALFVEKLLNKSESFEVYKSPELDILAYYPVSDSIKTTSGITRASHTVFDIGMREKSFYLSLFKIPAETFVKLHPKYRSDSETVTVLRSVFMKPEHSGFAEELVKRMEAAF